MAKKPKPKPPRYRWSWLLALLFLPFCWAPSAAQLGPPNQVLCNQTAPFTGTGAAATVVTGVVGKVAFFCGWHITNTAATGTFAITSGTTGTCGTGTVTVTPTLSVTSTAPSADHIEFAYFSAAQGANICVNATVTTVTGVLFFSLI
jgi:hypothetical protein